MPGASEANHAAAALGRLSERLRSRFHEWADAPAPWTNADLEELGREVFEFQYRFNLPYRKYCDHRHVTPDGVTDWRQIPPVPTAVFREVELVAGHAGEAALSFLTSGTTRGADRRGRHVVLDPEVYRASLRAAFKVRALRQNPIDMCTLHIPFTISHDSSLGWMLDDVLSAYGRSGSIHAAGPDGLDCGAALRFCERAAAAGRPVFLLGTTLAFDEWLAWLHRKGLRIALPAGSRAMDTGGTKGRGGLSRKAVMEAFEERLGVVAGDVLNEFGMTELLSQRYATHTGSAGGGNLLVGPPWLRTRALDPVTLEELPDGEPGILCHFDLANVGSVSMVLTEDVGVTRGEGIEWLGRTPGAPPRGCSLATADLLEAQNAG